MAKTKSPDHLTGRLSIDAPAGKALSDTRVRLLEEIDRLGSINRAAKAVPLSYKAAWDAIDAMNNLSPEPLVLRTTGGRQGGGTMLTDYGRRMVAMYRALEIETQAALERVAERLAGDGPFGVDDFRRIMRRMGMRTSARNQFSGPVVGLRDGEVDYEVRLRIDRQTEIVAVITKTGAEDLGLAIGREAFALIKSSSVLLSTEPDVRLSARNQLWGEVSDIHEGAVNDEVTLVLPSGKNITSVVTHGSRERLGLKPGVRACAVFKSSSVILAAGD